MAIRIACPFCNTANTFNDDKRGKKVACRGCKKALSVPAASTKKKRAHADAIQQERKGSALPVRRRAQEDDEESEARPSAQKKKEKKAKKGFPILWVALGGVALLFFLLVGGAGVGAFFYWRSRTGNEQNAAVAKADNKNTDNADPNTTRQPDPKGTKEEKKDPPAVEVKATPGLLTPEIAQRVKQATVQLKATLPNDQVVEGSGFFVLQPGLILTNTRVLGMADENSPKPAKIEVVLNSGQANEARLAAQVLGVDRAMDLVLLRVSGPTLPPPLALDASGKLNEAQKVSIAGLPTNDKPGKDITINDSLVTKLQRNAKGTLEQIQIGSGLHPGNSGGPVVNSDGNVVGVAVASAKGMPANFAVPAETVTLFTSGRLSDASLGEMMTKDGLIMLPVKYMTFDPLNRIKEMRVEVWTGMPGQARPASAQKPAPNPNDGPRQTFPLTYQDGIAQFNVPLPSLDAGQVCWLQPVLVASDGTTQWGPAASLAAPMTATKSDLKPIDFTQNLKATRERTVKWKSTLTNTVTARGDKLAVADRAEMDFVEVLNFAGPAELKMAAVVTGFGMLNFSTEKNDLVTPADKQLLDALRTIAPTYQLDDTNKMIKYIPVGLPAQNPLRSAVEELRKQTYGIYVDTILPLPRNTVQPKGTFPAKLQVHLKTLNVLPPLAGKTQKGLRTSEDSTTIELNMICKYEGVQTRNSRSEVLLSVSGQLKGLVDPSTSSGNITGKIGFDVEGGFISSTELKAVSDYDMQVPVLGMVRRNLQLDINLDRFAGNPKQIQLAQMTTKPDPGPDPLPKPDPKKIDPKKEMPKKDPPPKPKIFPPIVGQVTNFDPPDPTKPKVGKIQTHMKAMPPMILTAGKTYHFDVKGAGFHPHVRLENAGGLTVAQGGGAGPDARINYRAVVTGGYRLVVSTHTLKTGQFSLTIVESP